MNSSALEYLFNQHQKELESLHPGISLKTIQDYLEVSLPTLSLYSLFEQLLTGKPIHYIFKKKFFYKSYFYVDERVLIPRNETEILVENVISHIKNNNIKKIAEVGVGSGAISLSIAQEVNESIEFLCTDISEAALEVFKINHFRHYLNSHKFQVQLTDRLSGVDEVFDCIVSNPPYIKENAQGVHHQVLAFEPHLALFLKQQEYDQWFLEFFSQVSQRLITGGLFFMEGHEDELEKMREICQSFFSHVDIIKDYTNRDRFLKAIK